MLRLFRGLFKALKRKGVSTQIDAWLTQATKPLEPSDTDPGALAKYKAYTAMRDKIKAEITTLRERVTHFNLPYLSLPADTSKDVALQVFINMNTNSKPLSLYDIIVAEVENVASTSLHELVSGLNDKHPMVRRYGDVSGLVLSTSALLQDQTPNIRGMVEMDKKQFLANWPKLERGLERQELAHLNAGNSRRNRLKRTSNLHRRVGLRIPHVLLGWTTFQKDEQARLGFRTRRPSASRFSAVKSKP